MDETYNEIEARKKAAALIKSCLYSNVLVREALKLWPEINNDPSLICARHALIHFETDEDIRNSNVDYAEGQIQWLEELIQILSQGDPLPENIIETYKEYYEIPIPLKTKIAYKIARAINTFKHCYNSIFKAKK